MYASAFSDEEADPEEEDSKPKSPAFVIEEPEGALQPRSPSHKVVEVMHSHSSMPEEKDGDEERDEVGKQEVASKMLASTSDKNRSYYFYQGN